MTRHGECNNCGWCCTYTGHSVANISNKEGVTDPEYLQRRGFKLHFYEGRAVLATARVSHHMPCPDHSPIIGCTVYNIRPETCRNFPVNPGQIIGTPCSYWFEHDGHCIGGDGSPHPQKD